MYLVCSFCFFNDTATTEIYTLSLHDALPIWEEERRMGQSWSGKKIRIAPASEREREAIYRLRHQVYPAELGQHSENPGGRITDALDAFNVYLTASLGGRIIGFVSITPPGGQSYSVDKYFPREAMPFAFDDGVYEVRLLTVHPSHRGGPIASLLMYAAFRWIESRNGKRIVAIGRREIMDLYRKAGLQ